MLFNMSLFLFLKTKMNGGSLEIVFKETSPSFYWNLFALHWMDDTSLINDNKLTVKMEQKL